MAQLKDTVVTGNLSVTDTTQTQKLIVTSLTANQAILTGATSTTAVTTRAITNNTSATAVAASTNLITANTLYYHSGNSNIVTVGNITSGTWNGTTINPNRGGTGVNSYAKGDILYAGAAIANTATTALSKLTISSTAGYVLETSSSGIPGWINATASNVVSTIVKRDSNGDFTTRAITLNRTDPGNYITLQQNGTESGSLKLETLGSTSEEGIVTLTLGNSNASTVDKNASGKLTLYNSTGDAFSFTTGASSVKLNATFVADPVVAAGTWTANTDGTSETDVMCQSGAGRIYLFSQASSTTGLRGIYAINAAGTGRRLFYVNQSNWLMTSDALFNEVSGSAWATPLIINSVANTGTTYTTVTQSFWGDIHFQLPVKVNSNNSYLSSSWTLRTYSHDGAGARVSYCENYSTPAVTVNLTADKYYTILTTKGIAGANSTYVAGRDNAILKMNVLNGYSPMLSLKSNASTWEIGTYNGVADALLFTNISDTNYSSSTNTYSGQVIFTSLGEIISLTQNAFRLAYGNYGVIIRNDGSGFYLLVTNSGQALTGSWNTLRPFGFDLASGRAIMNNGLSVGGYANTTYTLSTASFICQSWIRTVGATGWYNESYGGGWYMTDGTWIRSYGNKSVYVNTGDLRCDGSTWGGAVRMTSNWIGFYAAAGNSATRYGYIQCDVNRMYFRKENGVDTYHFDFGGGHIRSTGNIWCQYLYMGPNNYTFLTINDLYHTHWNYHSTSTQIQFKFRATSGASWVTKYHINSAGNAGSDSSRTVKHNIVPIETIGDTLDRLTPITFSYNGDPKETKLPGLIFEDTIDVLPEICMGSLDHLEDAAINYAGLTPYLLKEIQDLRKRIKLLEQNSKV